MTQGLARLVRPLAFAACALALLVQNGCGSGRQQPGDAEGARAWVETDRLSGGEVVVLRVDAPRVIEARIAPGAGANLYSLSWDGIELLYRPDTLSAFDGSSYGVPVLYPSPCRIPGGTFSFRDEKFDFGCNAGGTHIHGLVRNAAWQYSPPEASDGTARLVTWIDFQPGSPLYAKFPFDHRLTLTYTLDSSGLRLAFEVENRDRRPLPFGFGLHPYWRYAGGRDCIRLSAPVERRMELRELVPTGKLLPVADSPWDLDQPQEVSRLRMDDVFTGMKPESPARIEYQRAGLELALETSDRFGHLIVYAQPENPFFCVENLTCSPDAYNVYDRGFAAESGLLVAEPGARVDGWVKFALRPLR